MRWGRARRGLVFVRRAHLSEAGFRRVVRLFALDLTATDAAELTGLTRKTVTDLDPRIRRRLAEAGAHAAPFTPGEVEVDGASFGARRVRGKPGRGAGGETPVVGLRKRDGRVYAEVVPNCSKAVLQQVVRGRVPLESVKHRLAKFRGVAPHTFHLHLKECEWRFNTPRDRRHRADLTLLEEHPL